MSELVFFFFKQKTAYEMRISYWSSDVCSSDLDDDGAGKTGARRAVGQRFTRQATRHYHRIRRNLAHEYLASVAIHNLGGGRDEHPQGEHGTPAHATALNHFETGANKAIDLNQNDRAPCRERVGQHV